MGSDCYCPNHCLSFYLVVHVFLSNHLFIGINVDTLLFKIFFSKQCRCRVVHFSVSWLLLLLLFIHLWRTTFHNNTVTRRCFYHHLPFLSDLFFTFLLVHRCIVPLHGGESSWNKATHTVSRISVCVASITFPFDVSLDRATLTRRDKPNSISLSGS